MTKLEGFEYKDCVIAGDECVLIYPIKNFGVVWTEENKKFRSVIVRKSDGFVVSRGFNKFHNFFEKPEFEPWSDEWPIEARHKMDGSLLIVSKYKGELICRTRGTVDARNLPNGHEIDGLIKKYRLDKIFGPFDSSPSSLLFEWTTPTNVIVVQEHSEPTLTLLGLVFNESGEYASQKVLDVIGLRSGIPRPIKYSYSSVSEMLADVAAWRGKEGVVAYSPDGQTLKKGKSELYKKVHYLKSYISSWRALVGVYAEAGLPRCPETFYKYIEATLDYEIAESCRDRIKKVVEAHEALEEEKSKVRKWLNSFGTEFSRKELAFEVNLKYRGKNCRDWRKGFAFVYLDGKDLDADKMAKLIEDLVKDGDEE